MNSNYFHCLMDIFLLRICKSEGMLATLLTTFSTFPSSFSAINDLFANKLDISEVAVISVNETDLATVKEVTIEYTEKSYMIRYSC